MGIEIKEPRPRVEDTRAEFMQRCVVDPETSREFSDNVLQRIAFCGSQWEKAHESFTPESIHDILLEATSASFDSSPSSMAGLLATERFSNALMVYFDNLYGKFPFGAFSEVYEKTLQNGVRESRESFITLHEAAIGANLEVILAAWIESEFQLLEELSIEGVDQGQKVGWRGGINDLADNAGLTSPFKGEHGFIPQTNEASLAAARKRSGQLVKGISGQTRNQIGQIIENGLRTQKGTDAIAKEIAGVLGDADRTRKRANVIAKTETNRAMSKGARNAADQVGAKEKEWVTVGDRRVNVPICQANEGDGKVGRTRTFSSGHGEPPGHASCRCVAVYFGADSKKIKEALVTPTFGSGDIPSAAVFDAANAISTAKNLTRQTERRLNEIREAKRNIDKELRDMFGPTSKFPDKAVRDAEYKRLWKEKDALSAEGKRRKKELWDDITGAVVENPNDIKLKAFGKESEKLKDKYEKLINQAFDEKVVAAGRPKPIKVEVIDDGTKREFQRWLRGGRESSELHLNSRTPADIFLHEFGHSVEFYNPKARKLIQDFRKSRTKGEKLEKLSKLTKNHRYADNEVAFKDKFFNPYIGKMYPGVQGGATEILSMGIQEMFHDPIKFLRKDPEMFELILRIMGGLF